MVDVRSSSRLAARVATLVGLLLVGMPASNNANAIPHEKDQSYVLFELRSGRIDGQFQATLADLNAALDLGFKTDGSATREDVVARRDALLAYYQARVEMSVDGSPLRLEYGEVDILEAEFGQWAVVNFTLPELDHRPAQMSVRYTAFFDVVRSHTALVAIMYDWESGIFDEPYVALAFTGGGEKQELNLAESASIWRGLGAVVKLGMIHIWEGIDHIFFLVALILPAVVRRGEVGWEPVSSFKTAFVYIVKVVTLFTLAHSVTLSLAALDVVNLNPRLVESVIAASILAAAIDILFPIFGSRIWLVVFGFGLFHGFGFAGALSSMGLTDDYAGLTLFGFNVGVELGQIVVISLVFPLLYVIRRWKGYSLFVLRGGAVALSAIASIWLVERLFDINVPLGAFAQKLAGLLA